MEENKFEEIRLKDIFMIVWKRRVLLAIVVIATILIGAFVTIILPGKVYESEVDIEVSGTDTSLNISSSTDQSIQNMLNEMIKPLDINFVTYVEYLVEDEVLENTIKDLKLEDEYSVDTLRSKLNITTDEEDLSINVKFSSSDPEEPTKVLGSLIDNYAEYITEDVKGNSEEILKALKQQTKIEKEKYENTFETYENFINENKTVDEYEVEIEAMYKQIVDFKTSLKNLEIKEKGARAAIKENSSSGSSGGSILQGNDGSSMYIGDAGNVLDINLSEIVAMKDETRKTIKTLEEEIKQINIDYQRAEIEAISINQKLDISKESYQSFAKTYETIQTISLFDKGKLGITVLSKPKEADRVNTSTKAKIVLMIALGIVFGVISTFISAFLDYRKVKNNKITQ